MQPTDRNDEAVLLLHGLGRTRRSMEPLAHALQAAGLQVANPGYPSRSGSIESLARSAVQDALRDLETFAKVHLVTHSMGGILVRAALAKWHPHNLGRVVMLAPPNRGSELVDRFGSSWWFRLCHGPAGTQLGTGREDLPRRLGRVDFELGVIAGDRHLGQPGGWLLPHPNDGKVSVRSTRVAGMKEHLTVHAGHTFLMGRADVQAHTLQFLRTGSFHTWNDGLLREAPGMV